MNYETIVICVFALLIGMLIANMLNNICGCKVVEGQNNKLQKCNDPRNLGKGETGERLMYTKACINCSNTVEESNIFIFDPDNNEKCRALSKSDVNTAECYSNGILVNKDNEWNTSYGPGSSAPIKPCIGNASQCNKKPSSGIINKACKVCGKENSWYSPVNGGCSSDSKCPDDTNYWIKYSSKECSHPSVPKDCAQPGTTCLRGTGAVDCCHTPGCPANGMCP